MNSGAIGSIGHGTATVIYVKPDSGEYLIGPHQGQKAFVLQTLLAIANLRDLPGFNPLLV